MAGSVTVAESAPALIQQLRAEGYELAAAGDRLRIRPVELVTPELRDMLSQHKAELLSLLAPHEFVTLRNGLTLPLPVLQLAWNLEDRGFRMSLESGTDLHIEPVQALSAADREAIARWRRHLNGGDSLHRENDHRETRMRPAGWNSIRCPLPWAEAG